MLGIIFDSLLVQPIFNLLLSFYSLVGDFGVAIILFVIVTRIALYPLIKSQYNQTRIMRKIQPEIARIRKKYRDNPQRQYLMISALQKKNGVKISRSLLSTLIQLPILIAMYRVIYIILSTENPVAQYAYGFIKNLSGVTELALGEAQINTSFLGIVDLSNKPFDSSQAGFLVSLLILALMALSQYLLTKRMQQAPVNENGQKRRLKDIFKEASEGKEHDQDEMNQIVSGSMSKFMPVMFFFMMGGFYSALSFYYLLANVINILQYSYVDRKEALPEAQSIEESEIAERLRKAESAQIINEQRQRAKRKRRHESTTTTKSGQRITRIKAKK